VFWRALTFAHRRAGHRYLCHADWVMITGRAGEGPCQPTSVPVPNKEEAAGSLGRDARVGTLRRPLHCRGFSGERCNWLAHFRGPGNACEPRTYIKPLISGAE